MRESVLSLVAGPRSCSRARSCYSARWPARQKRTSYSATRRSRTCSRSSRASCATSCPETTSFGRCGGARCSCARCRSWPPQAIVSRDNSHSVASSRCSPECSTRSKQLPTTCAPLSTACGRSPATSWRSNASHAIALCSGVCDCACVPSAPPIRACTIHVSRPAALLCIRTQRSSARAPRTTRSRVCPPGMCSLLCARSTSRATRIGRQRRLLARPPRTGLRALALPSPQAQPQRKPSTKKSSNSEEEAARGPSESLTRAQAERALGSVGRASVHKLPERLQRHGVAREAGSRGARHPLLDGAGESGRRGAARIAAALRAAPAVLICYSQSYTQSSYCKAEANAAFRWDKPLVALCVEAGYVADYWLAIVIAAASSARPRRSSPRASSASCAPPPLGSRRSRLLPRVSFSPLSALLLLGSELLL